MAKKVPASKKVTKPVTKPVVKAAAKSAAKPLAKQSAKAAAKPVVKSATKAPAKKTEVKKTEVKKTEVKKTEVKKTEVKKTEAHKKEALAKPKSEISKPALMTKKGSSKSQPAEEPKDQGDLLIEMAKDEMSKVNAAKVAAEKNAKVKPIKIERGNAADEKAKWQELYKRHGKEKSEAYKMTESFEALKPIQHKVLGWGFVLSNENNRLEVLFENGIKMLISNYKPS